VGLWADAAVVFADCGVGHLCAGIYCEHGCSKEWENRRNQRKQEKEKADIRLNS
jgi:hypothetical protein